MDIETLEELLLGNTGLLISLRMGDGVQQVKVSQIIEVIDHLSEEWAESESIPKKAANLFVDLYAAAYSTLGLYSEEEMIRIEDAVDKIMDSVRKCWSDKTV
ncbi:hypothetical protein A8F94_00940 [Bacillus sp. FJAT-27225]|uniref:hypothetical protein n=1 Tax=Bacillus sp. FJAT-27225 TaxID=1743144 RepID=UPI00080C32BC|nr:hypothetical protein [Bacillus sp. FJAT-27225]OCA90486.1 hypothetical protein A8F94_00940 [Bacillus sp. FJAT-27225]